MNEQELRARLDELQIWFAGKRPGWRERATEGQIQQYEDREREEAGIIERLELMIHTAAQGE